MGDIKINSLLDELKKTEQVINERIILKYPKDKYDVCWLDITGSF